MYAVPVIDVSPLAAGPDSLRAVAREIGAAARGIGFFSIVNHGVPAALCDEVFTVARTFFALPEAEKEAIALDSSPEYLGFSRMHAEQLHPDLPGDLKESYNMGLDRCSTNQWPAQPGFRDTMLTYFGEVHALLVRLHRAVAVDLGAAPDHFDALLERTLGMLRLLHYPPHPGPVDDVLYGAAPHTDYGNITFLMQDDAGGLEVRARDGTWIAVPPQRGAFVCNIGDALMRWSNDVYVSTPHRVVNRSGRDRYSVVFFGDAGGEASIDPLPACCTPKRPRRYEPITYAAYLAQRLAETYAKSPAGPPASHA